MKLNYSHYIQKVEQKALHKAQKKGYEKNDKLKIKILTRNIIKSKSLFSRGQIQKIKLGNT